MSFGQPSPQGIASLYRGNPGKLDARIKEEQQGKPGMPPDLAKLLALQIDVNETDAVKRQQAMAALQGMQQQAPTGKPPTVAESLQQQAMQKARQLAVQQQQQQKGLQALMGQAAPAQAPEHPPQPEHQGSLEELQSNLGQEYASGGIIAFAEPTEENNNSQVEDPDVVKPKSPLRQVTQRELAEEYNRKRWAQQAEDEKRTSMAGDVGRALKENVYNPLAAAWNNLSERQKIRQQMEQNRPGLFEGLTDEERAARQAKSQGLVGQLNKLVDGESAAATAPADIRSQLNAAEARMQPAVAPNAAPVRDLAALAEQKKRAQNAAAAGTTNVPVAPTVTPEQSARDKFLAAQYAMTPEQRRDEALRRYAEQVGGPDTAAQEAYIKMLQGKVGGMDTQKDLAGRVGDYARKLALAGGRTSLQTGANASGMIEAERQANEQKKMDLLKEIMGESTKVADTKRGYKKEVFGIGEKEYDDAYKTAFESAKEQGLDDREAKKMAHQTAENVLNRANAVKVAQIGADARGGGVSGADKQKLAELKILLANKTAAMKNKYGSELAKLKAEAAPIEAAIAQMAGLDTIGTAPGAGSLGGTRPPLSSFQR